MALLLIKVPNYDHVEILAIRNGSIVVDYLLILRSSIEKKEEVVDQVSTILYEANCTSAETAHLCFNTELTKVGMPSVNYTGNCLNHPDIPKEVQQYYTAVEVSGVMKCVSACSDYSVNFMNCNAGKCSVTMEGPRCYCESTSDYWYTGDRCQTAISKPGVYAGVAVGLFVLLAIIVAMGIISYKRRNVPDKENLIQEKEVQWYEDGWEENNQDLGTKYSNSSISGSTGSNFKPDLTRVDPNFKMSLPRPTILRGK
ncbi:hypothetical protein GDO81_026598 [Engystomops pustulosus]|uniref:Uncharacterized protein n=2 Tax=Engystomops pustulosus TaxID=76066 RepID=A0AAV6ZKR6_ENGPU|nr:hypothetical protein GDO81_026598 [Engystomops pustulosus]